jgi:hypothetical protein
VSLLFWFSLLVGFACSNFSILEMARVFFYLFFFKQ